jgi:hypothetical protein
LEADPASSAAHQKVGGDVERSRLTGQARVRHPGFFLASGLPTLNRPYCPNCAGRLGHIHPDLVEMLYISEQAISAALPRLRRDAIFADLLAMRYLAPSADDLEYTITSPTGSASPLLDALDATAGLLPESECDVLEDGWRLDGCSRRATERSIHSYFFPFARGGQPGSKNTAWRPGDYNRSGLHRRFKTESRAPALREWVEYDDVGGDKWLLRLNRDYVRHAFETLLRGRPILIWDFVAWTLRYCPIPHKDTSTALDWAKETALSQLRIPPTAVAREESDASALGSWFFEGRPFDESLFFSETRLSAARLIDAVVASDIAAGGGIPDSIRALRREAELEGGEVATSPEVIGEPTEELSLGSYQIETVLTEDLLISEIGIEPEAELDVRSEPFDPTLIRVEAKPLTLDLLIRRIRLGELDLNPGFQRNEVWQPENQSRLIESILIRIPLPAFYFDATDDDTWVVVDGLQRLTALKKFVVDQDLGLTGLEFLHDYDGYKYDDLPRNLRRRIDETQITAYLIEQGTPPDVKFNIFKRINTGGLPLSPQEIRHALNQGPATVLLENLAGSQEFTRATGGSVRNLRMEDRELVLRFLAVAIGPRSSYSSEDLDTLLNEALFRLNRAPLDARLDLGRRFKRAMRGAYEIFGRHAFRKFYTEHAARNPINKALFEGWSANLDRLSDAELVEVIRQRDRVKAAVIRLLQNKRFFDAISQSTGDPSRVALRDEAIRHLLEEVLSAHQS